MRKKKHYKIGELSKICNVNPRTIDYYTTKGLIAPSVRSEANYRLYDESTIERLKWIQEMKEQKYTLDEIKKRLEWIDTEINEAVLSRQLESIIKDVEHLQRDLTSITPVLQKVHENGMSSTLRDKLEQLLIQDHSLIKILETVLERMA